MTVVDGLKFINAPQPERHAAAVPTNAEDAKTHRHLWAVGSTSVPYALEDCVFGQGLATGLVKHTNLTGGAPAHCAGEAWFLSDGKVVINGRSGRYGPREENQLRAAGLALKQCGYEVAMIGFDETGEPAAIAVGPEDLEWL